MAEITAQMVKDLRERTGIAMMKCKKALDEAGGDFAKAEDLLRKAGEATASKRSGRETSEGAVALAFDADGTRGAMVQLACETDFVAKNADFRAFAQELAALALERKPASLEAFLASGPAGATVEDTIKSRVGTTGENLKVQAVSVLDGGVCGGYIHHNHKVGVLLALTAAAPGAAAKDEVKELLLDVCQHVAFANPRGLSREDIAQDVVDKEREIYRAQMEGSGKPANIVEKIVEGKLNSFYGEKCLAEQNFVKDDKKKVRQVVAACGQKIGNALDLKGFARFEIGAV